MVSCAAALCHAPTPVYVVGGGAAVPTFLTLHVPGTPGSRKTDHSAPSGALKRRSGSFLSACPWSPVAIWAKAVGFFCFAAVTSGESPVSGDGPPLAWRSLTFCCCASLAFWVAPGSLR